MFKFDETLVINGNALTKKYIESLSKDERENLIEPIFDVFRQIGFPRPDDIGKIKSEYNRLVSLKVDTSVDSVYNNSSVATYICKYFCYDKFCAATEVGKRSMLDIFNDDKRLKRVIRNRLGLEWLDKWGTNESFNFTPRMLIQGFRSTREINMTSIFKPDIAKYLCEKYSNVGDTCYDPSAGWGGRMLGAASCGRKYIGVDPLTIPDLIKMRDYLGIEATLVDTVSEEFFGQENSVDFCFTSPPYGNQEYYSNDPRQAYSKGDDYFYNVYWMETLINIKFMLKPGKMFALNVTNQPKMVEMAKKMFCLDSEVKLRTVRSHLSGKSKDNGTVEKYEPVYIFRNIKL